MAKRVVVEGIQAWDIADAVGDRNVARGREYVERGAVIFSEWREEDLEIHAAVGGQRGRLYRTTVSFEPDDDGTLQLVDGLCSCPVGILCKHVAAVALSALGTRAEIGRGAGAPTAAPPRPTWESGLEALLPAPTSAAPTPTGALAIELAADGSGRLAARLLRPGAKGWVNGGLAWNRMTHAHVAREHRPDHLALVRELYALQQAASGGCSPSGYDYSEQRTIDLAAITSGRLWPCSTRPPRSAWNCATRAAGSGRSSGTAGPSSRWT